MLGRGPHLPAKQADSAKEGGGGPEGRLMVTLLEGYPMRLILILTAAAALAFVSTAEARHHHHHRIYSRTGHSGAGPNGLHKDNPTQDHISTPRSLPR